jgi:hypothetical protein
MSTEQVRCSLGITAPSFPRVWMAMQVKHGEHGDELVFNGKEHAVRKLADERPPNALVDFRKLDSQTRYSTEFRSGSRGQRALARIEAPLQKSRARPPPKHRAGASPRGSQAGEEFFADLGPGAARNLAASNRGEAFADDLPVPVGHRDFLGAFSEMIPQRLNVFELLIGRELVKARRREHRLRHAPVYRRPVCRPVQSLRRHWREQRTDSRGEQQFDIRMIDVAVSRSPHVRRLFSLTRAPCSVQR